MQHDAMHELKRAYERLRSGEITEEQYRAIVRKVRATTMHPPDDRTRRTE